jgi:hypothetical protein
MSVFCVCLLLRAVCMWVTQWYVFHLEVILAVYIIHPFDNYITTILFSTLDHLKWKGFQVFSHGLCTEKQNILLQHMHEKEFFILPINVEISLTRKRGFRS